MINAFKTSNYSFDPTQNDVFSFLSIFIYTNILDVLKEQLFTITWQSHVPEGTSVGQIAAHIDIVPTLLDLCNLTPAKKIEFDGISLAPPFIEDGEAIPWHRELFMEWETEFVNKGKYEFLIEYSYCREGVGSGLILEVDERGLDLILSAEFDPPQKILMGRVEIDQEAPEKEWAWASLGVLKLEKGYRRIRLRPSRIDGSETINLKRLIVKRG